MALLCQQITAYVVQHVTEPVDRWVEQQEKHCKQYPWYDPRGWFCWFVTILVKVTDWVVKTILLPIQQTYCTVITGFFGVLMLPHAAAIDAICQNCHAVDWVKNWLISNSMVTFINKAPTSDPDVFDYTFDCKCPNNQTHQITVQAHNDDEAAAEAKVDCAASC
jgi:hypothetical protein